MLKVLIIDDDDIVLLVERKILQRCGIATDPLSFKCGKSALDYIALDKNHQEFLILLDINMPEMNGWDFLLKLEELHLPNTYHVIMVTSSIDRYDKEIAVKYKNVISFIEKPITSSNCEEIRSLPEITSYFKIQ